MPRIRIRDAGGVLRTITRIRMRDASNVLQTIRRIRVRDASNVLRTVFQWPQMTASIFPPAVSGSDGSSPLIASIDTNTCTALVTGGTSPYTYLWTQVTFLSGLSWTIDASTSATTFFSALSVLQGTFQETFQVEVTDDTGAVATAQIIATIANTNTS